MPTNVHRYHGKPTHILKTLMGGECDQAGNGVIRYFHLLRCPCSLFFGEASPTKIDHIQKNRVPGFYSLKSKDLVFLLLVSKGM